MGIQVLIVEDDPLIAMDLRGIIQNNGYDDVQMVHDVASAEAHFAQLQNAFIFLDINLDERHGGIKLANILREKYPFPFAYVTANTDDDTLNKVQQTRPTGFIVKPFDEREILAILKIGAFTLKNKENSTAPQVSVELISRHFSVLTESESKMLLGLYQAKTNGEIADSVHLSVNTVKSHLKTLYFKLDVSSRVEAVQALIAVL